MTPAKTIFLHNTNPSQKKLDPKTRTTLAHYAASKSKRKRASPEKEAPLKPNEDLTQELAIRKERRSIDNRKGSRQQQQQVEFEATVTEDGNKTSSRYLFTAIGTLRNDPFDAYPIKPEAGVPEALDYYFQSFVPHNSRPFANVDGQSPWISQYIPEAMNHPVLFKGTIAMLHNSRMMQLKSQGLSTSEIDKQTMYHHTKALASLRERLMPKESCADDISVLTVLTLMTLDYTNQNPAAFITHRTALYKMVELRGGIENLGGKGFFKAIILMFEALYSFMNRTTMEYPSVDSDSFYYPRYVVKPDLCAVITRIPKGFKKLASTQKLSAHSIHLLSELASETDNIAHTREYGRFALRQQKPQFASEYLASQNSIPSTEKYLVLTCLLYIYEMSRNPETRSTMEALFEQVLHSFMESFIAYSHQVDTALNGSKSLNVGSPMTITFTFRGPCPCRPTVSKQPSELATLSVPDQTHLENDPSISFKTRDQLEIQVHENHIDIRYPQDEGTDEAATPAELDRDQLDQILAQFLWSQKLRKRWLECWQASESPVLGATGVFPWMGLTDRVMSIRSSAIVDGESIAQGHAASESP